MPYHIEHLHHLTATVARSGEDLHFYQDILGLRLVKKTVNFDNHNVYHYYYGTEVGAPGTIMTTFPYESEGIRKGIKGTGQVSQTAFSIPPGSLDAWSKRLDSYSIPIQDSFTRFGESGIRVFDPSGLEIELIESQDDREPWLDSELDDAMSIRGLHSVSLSLKDASATQAFLKEVLGFEAVETEHNRTRVQTNGSGAGHYLDLLHEPEKDRGKNGIGTVHHVALAIRDFDAQERLREELVEMGRNVTDLKDRKYFRSIYFREPGGVLLEIATLDPGFTVDEAKSELGTHLMLPPWEEPNRADIEAYLIANA